MFHRQNSPAIKLLLNLVPAMSLLTEERTESCHGCCHRMPIALSAIQTVRMLDVPLMDDRTQRVCLGDSMRSYSHFLQK